MEAADFAESTVRGPSSPKPVLFCCLDGGIRLAVSVCSGSLLTLFRLGDCASVPPPAFRSDLMSGNLNGVPNPNFCGVRRNSGLDA